MTPEDVRKRLCPLGHGVSLVWRWCPMCGARLEPVDPVADGKRIADQAIKTVTGSGRRGVSE